MLVNAHYNHLCTGEAKESFNAKELEEKKATARDWAQLLRNDWPKTVQKACNWRKEKDALERENELDPTVEEFKVARKKLRSNLIESLNKYKEVKEEETYLKQITCAEIVFMNAHRGTEVSSLEWDQYDKFPTDQDGKIVHHREMAPQPINPPLMKNIT